MPSPSSRRPLYPLRGYYRGGQVFRESSHSDSYEEAERLLKIRGGEVATGKFHGLGPENITVDELLEDVLLDYEVNGKEVRFARNAIDNHVRRFFGKRRAMSVTTGDVKRYVAYRRSKKQGTRMYRGRRKKAKRIRIRPVSNATINRELAMLKHAFYVGVKHTPPKVFSVPYIPLLEENNIRKGFFEDDQYLALRRTLLEDLSPVLAFAYNTGCRRGEILSLQWP